MTKEEGSVNPDPIDHEPLGDPASGPSEALRGQSPLFWIGLALFGLPFVAVPLAMLGIFVPPIGLLGLGAVPCAFLLAVVGMVFMIVASIRTSSRRAAVGGSHGRRDGRWSMRGDHPAEIHVEDEVGRSPVSTHAVDARERFCDHCGVECDTAGPNCPRCGAARHSSD